MSDNAADTLRKVRSTEMRQPVKRANPEHFYVKLVVFKLRRRQLTIALIGSFLAYLSVIAKDYRVPEHGWWLVALPITALGVLFCLLPATEEWEYKPWQARARQYERHQIE